MAHISGHVDICGRSFLSLAEALTVTPRFAAQVSVDKVNDEFGRFKIWVGNIAAHRKGRRSLEYRLRDAAHLKTETHNLLAALQKRLADALSIARGEKTPWDELSDSDTESESGSDMSELQGDTELKQLFAGVKNTVTCLFRLSMAIRDPAPNSQHRSTITVDKSFFQEHDIQHVRAKFGEGRELLTARLGRAISGRRQYLAYREEHHRKLSKNIEKVGFEEPRTEHTANSTEASPLPVSGASTAADVADDDALSQTSYAISVDATIRVPPLPRAARQQEQFECPLCFMIVSIHTTAAWKQHVYRDLFPYSCTFEDCATADRLYDSRHAWFKHELEAHRISWQCVQGCDTRFTAEKDFDDHVRNHHQDLAVDKTISLLKQTAIRGALLADLGACTLCHKAMSLRALQKHLGHHQEQLALFALPPNLESTEDDPPDDEMKNVDVGKWDEEDESDSSAAGESDNEHPGEDFDPRLFPKGKGAKAQSDSVPAHQMYRCSSKPCDQVFIHMDDYLAHRAAKHRPFRCIAGNCYFKVILFRGWDEIKAHFEREHPNVNEPDKYILPGWGSAS